MILFNFDFIKQLILFGNTENLQNIVVGLVLWFLIYQFIKGVLDYV